jgi:CO dehydrogenase/acetyl-CoA synthase epsilon subunit
VPAPASAGDASGVDWLRQVALLGGSDAAIRRTTAQRLIDALRQDRDLTTTGTLVRALVEQLSDAQIRGLSATGRYNTLVVLGTVSPEQWRQLPDQAATLRANLDALEKRARDGLVTIGQDTAREISKVRSKRRFRTLPAAA